MYWSDKDVINTNARLYFDQTVGAVCVYVIKLPADECHDLINLSSEENAEILHNFSVCTLVCVTTSPVRVINVGQFQYALHSFEVLRAFCDGGLRCRPITCKFVVRLRSLENCVRRSEGCSNYKINGIFYVLCCADSSFIIKSNRACACTDVQFYSGNLNGKKK
jgi:hypothetical protein